MLLYIYIFIYLFIYLLGNDAHRPIYRPVVFNLIQMNRNYNSFIQINEIPIML